MGIFDFLSEVKIQEWLKRKDMESYTPSTKIGKTTFGKPIEGHLMDDIKGLLEQSYYEKDGNKKEKILKKANNLEIQLILSYETQGHHLLAQNAQKELQKFKNMLSKLSTET